jgi:hypothetical protein
MSSFGPVNTTRRKFGECCTCWDENHSRDTAHFFESRQRMIGAVCGHRLKAVKRPTPQFRINAINQRLREEPSLPHYREDYWAKRALLPDYCGEYRELCPGPANDRYVDGTT